VGAPCDELPGTYSRTVDVMSNVFQRNRVPFWRSGPGPLKIWTFGHSVLGDEIGKAEMQVRNSVHLSLPGAKEDDITTLFVVESERCLGESTKSGRIASAVRADRENAYWSHGYAPPTMLAQVSAGLVARGLLVQAKRRHLRDGRWNRFTDTQLEKLPRRMAYAALLRYEFADARGRQLKRFDWHPLSGLDIAVAAGVILGQRVRSKARLGRRKSSLVRKNVRQPSWSAGNLSCS